MAVRDFILSYFAETALLDQHLKGLQRDYLLFQPNVVNRQYKQFVADAGGSVLGLWNKARKAGDELGRVCVMGFSEGCQGVSATLDCPDANGIDAVFAIDGIHRELIDPTGTVRAINPVALSQYIAFAKLAAATPPSVDPNGKLMVITHSAIGKASLPVNMASTTETSEVILKEVLSNPPNPLETRDCGWGCPAAVHESNLLQVAWPDASLPLGTTLPSASITNSGWTTVRPVGAETGFIPSATFSWGGLADGWTTRQTANNLYVYGWSYPTGNKTKDPTGNRDHVFQAQMVLPYVAREFLVSRWNPSCGTAGLGDPATCSTGNGVAYGQQVGPLINPYPQGIAVPVIANNCPQPPPGQIILGRPGDPCWTGVPPSGDMAKMLVEMGAVFAGGVGGYYAVKYLAKNYRSWLR